MDIIRYDGTRFITEEEVDQEFTGKWVLVSLIGTDNPWDGGYLVASADGRDELRYPLSEIAMDEFNSNAKVIYGCKERGGNLHVELLG
ncbi:MAG: hypothetical protein FWB80_06890 [Defluviitaleaceae bacterium]|nr:hypothetical protein [Defluviitaleaceae bacterium]